MTLGIAIPCTVNHFEFLGDLLEKLSESTVLPDEVSISISSFSSTTNFKNYNFKLKIQTTKDQKNACENRNIAANNLTTDIISFFDADDLPHIKRNEYIKKSFLSGSKVLVHNYHLDKNRESGFYKNEIGDFKLSPELINSVKPNLQFATNVNKHEDYACGHITVLKSVFEKIKYNESIGHLKGEDGEYTKRLVENDFKICYSFNKLSQYYK